MYHDKIPILVEQPRPSVTAQSDSASSIPGSEAPRTSVLMELTDSVGILHDVRPKILLEVRRQREPN